MQPIVSALYRQAVSAHRANEAEQAERYYRQILVLDPEMAAAHHLLGILLSAQARHDAAVRHLRRAVDLEPSNPPFHHNLGEALRRQGRPGEAAACYRRALEHEPRFTEAHFCLGNVSKQLDRLQEAALHYETALRCDPGHLGARYNLANTYLEAGRFRSAAAQYEQILRLDPRHASARNNLGVALKELDRLDEAVQQYREAIRLQPGFVEAYRNLGQVLEKLGREEAARQAYAHVVRLVPQDRLFRLSVETWAPVIPASNADIDRYRTEVLATLGRYRSDPPRLDPATVHTSGGEPPWLLPYQGRDDRTIKEQWAALFDGLFTAEPLRTPGDKPHVGFVVTRGHEGVFLKGMRGIVERLPASRFRVTVVCSRWAGEAILRGAIVNPAVGYLALPDRLDRAAALVREAAFDVLHFWEVGTDTMNYFLPFYRLAPVQCTSWGWPVTTGIPQMDYFLSCEGLETPESDAHYTERLVRFTRLPTYYYRPPVPERPLPRTHFGLPEDRPFYFCPQNLRKIHPDFDALAGALLRRNPDGLLGFVEDARPAVTALLRRRLEATLPDVVDRVRFLPRQPEPAYLSLLARANVVLDTLHYGGGANTTYDAFAAGTPVVTLPTRFHRGRYTAAAYRQIGLSEGVTGSPDAYVETAYRLAHDAEARAELSRRITGACPALFEDAAAVVELADFFETALASAHR